ncbi:cobalt transporter [Bifidobacterium saguinibicoloris]|uniref:cobalt transporter n=1 Tax=Bifidobacterium saguinibicoloris TaxID=2834433 RepID=UPI001C59DC96|nr:cobalt transporter [Bifidobacterium saguinibicoloris]MBW3079958.1 cobalt transporter [Bifidobacterium saguinibicoloris]
MTWNDGTHGPKRTAVPIAILMTTGACLIVVAFVVVFLWARSGTAGRTVSQPADHCTVTTADGGYPLSPTQTRNASLIAAISVRRGLPDHAATVAIATAMQESKLVNLDHGDLDSVGLFQQRPSQGWGTVEQLTDESYATNAFYDELVKVADWQTIPVEDAAQAVQRSGYPDLYAQWDGMARAWAAAFTGETAAGVTCSIHTKISPDPDGLVTAFRDMFPSATIAGQSTTDDGSAASPTALTITLPEGSSGSDPGRQGWQAATWLVAHAHEYGVDAVHANGMDWARTSGRWTGAESMERTVTVTLR